MSEPKIKKKIAIVGSGISGLASAYYLRGLADVSIFESNSYIGGHTHTHTIETEEGSVSVDTGFIVFNDKTYPLYRQILNDLSVKSRPTTMSFSVKSDDADLEYNGTTINSLFAQRRNLIRPSFLFMVRDILKFNELAKKLILGPETNVTVREFIKEHKFSKHFLDWYLSPMAAAVWSCGLEQVQDMPIFFLARFFENHGFLNVNDRPQWYTVEGGSKSYIGPLLKAANTQVETDSKIISVRQRSQGAEIEFKNKPSQLFDKVIFACHSDSAIRLIESPQVNIQTVLNAIKWSHNSVLLHTDTSILPKRKLAWAAWNYHLVSDKKSLDTKPIVTYNMNMLQGLQSNHTYLVTLNHHDSINKSKILRSLEYSHPIFDLSCTKAQSQWESINGQGSPYYFAGAYWFNGFHEDGARSAKRVTDLITRELLS